MLLHLVEEWLGYQIVCAGGIDTLPFVRRSQGAENVGHHPPPHLQLSGVSREKVELCTCLRSCSA
jgi:hypothetical protein